MIFLILIYVASKLEFIERLDLQYFKRIVWGEKGALKRRT